MRNVVIGFTFTFATMMFTSPLHADNAIEVDETYREQALKFFTHETVLIWSCPTCSYRGEVFKVKSAKPVTYTSGKVSIEVKKALVMAARNGIDKLDRIPCATSETSVAENYDTLGDQEGWSVDFSYTYYSPENDGTFIPIGPLFGISNNSPRIVLSKVALNKIRKCAETAVDEQ